MKTLAHRLSKPGDTWIIEDARERGRIELVCTVGEGGALCIEVYIGDEEPAKAGQIVPFTGRQ